MSIILYISLGKGGSEVNYLFFGTKSPANSQTLQVQHQPRISTVVRFIPTTRYTTIDYCKSIIRCIAHNLATTTHARFLYLVVLFPKLTMNGMCGSTICTVRLVIHVQAEYHFNYQDWFATPLFYFYVLSQPYSSTYI